MTEIAFIPNSQIPEVSEDNVREFEQLLGVRLPDDYRNYLLRHNGEMPGKTDYWMPGEKNWIESVTEMYAGPAGAIEQKVTVWRLPFTCAICAF